MSFLLSAKNSGQDPAFNCPNCHLLTSHKVDFNLINAKIISSDMTKKKYTKIINARCRSCSETSIILQHSNFYKIDSHEDESSYSLEEISWQTRPDPSFPNIPIDFEVITSQKVIEPDNFVDVPNPNLDLSAETIKLYNEAASVLSKSPRAAVALLRVAFETFLRNDLRVEGKSINDMLGNLYSSGIPKQMDIALHFVRIAGNAADHTRPGEIQLDGEDGIETAKTLFGIINYVADEQITQKKKLTGLTKFFTPGQQEAIDRLHKKHK